MRKFIFYSILVIVSTLPMSHTPKAFEWYDQDGKSRNFDKLVKEALRSDVVLFGELHDDPVAHWLQLRVAKALYEADSAGFFMGAEMFERDQQVLLTEYVQELIPARNFEDQARLWPNYGTDYKPLVEFAREHHIPFRASNLPRRYASIIARQGPQALDRLDGEARNWVYQDSLEVDFGLSQYEKMMEMGGGMHGGGMKPENFVYAQAAKDKTMAQSILNGMEEGGKRCLHFNGSFHSDYFQGVMHYLVKEKPGLRIMTISTVRTGDPDVFPEEAKGRADYILVVDEDMTRTH